MHISEKTPNWFERHLNWTVGLNYFIVAAIRTAIVYSSPGSNSLWYTVWIILLVEIVLVCAWALRKKGRSLWWLLLLLLGFVGLGLIGLILILTFKNLNSPRLEEAAPCMFIGDKSTGIYHLPTCHLVGSIHDGNEIWFPNVYAAKSTSIV